MKYESTILKRLIDTYGVVGNPRYISEIIKEFIVRGKECFPELFTYQADWLAHIDEFGLNPSYTVRYTGQSIYAPNTLERPVKSAILKGQTLVNISMINKFSLTNGNKIARTYGKMIYGKKYLQIIAITKNTMTNSDNNGIAQINAYEYNSNHNFDVEDTIVSGFIGVKKLIGMASRNGKRHDTSLRTYSNSVGVLEGYEILIEYQDGMENWDIPYFEGMQSVKMPVLTTIGKNLFDGTWEDGYTLNANGEKISTSVNRSISSFIEVNESFSIYSSPIVVFRCYDEHKNDLNGDSNSTRPTSGLLSFKPNTKYIRVVVDTSNIDNKNNFMIVTSKEHLNTYEPYKSNILTVNEPVELRGIGDVKDTLNCLTGEVVHSVGILNGEETGWKREVNTQTPTDSSLIAFSIDLIKSPNKNLLSSVLEKSSDVNKPYRWYVSFNTWLTITLPKSEATNLDEFKAWLKNNEVLYPLSEKSIKTVDLTILDQNGQSVDHLKSFNGGTHVYTSSLEGSLVPSVDISVVTNLEETLKICSLEGNTM